MPSAATSCGPGCGAIPAGFWTPSTSWAPGPPTPAGSQSSRFRWPTRASSTRPARTSSSEGSTPRSRSTLACRAVRSGSACSSPPRTPTSRSTCSPACCASWPPASRCGQPTSPGPWCCPSHRLRTQAGAEDGAKGQPCNERDSVSDELRVEEVIEPVVPSRHRWLASLLQVAPDDRVVDLGCGTGASLRFLLPSLRGGLAVGLDGSASVLAECAAVDGTIGRRLADLAGRSPLAVLDVRAAVVVSRRFQPGELGYAYAHHLVGVLRRTGSFSAPELDAWLEGLRRLDDRGGFLFSLNDYAVVCEQP